ncbi:hypothetical protein [Roseiterribacter gracilis]|uniref:Uncharacterized protein n=1 Tax=Roseiterribacter gracilis TaxID=2812848 RepID=A0A8S8XFF0_9PROT|nr:hypothetical protein TMPK1_29280 [Rhodospirillales bacterium TMPK1]
MESFRPSAQIAVEYLDVRSGGRERVNVGSLHLAKEIADELAAIGARPVVQVFGPNGWEAVQID